MDWSDWDRKSLEDKGFVEWIRWADWPPPEAELASAAGVYVLFRWSQSKPQFLDRSTGATHKKRDPSVGREALTANWVPAANVIYIGKAHHHRLRGGLNEHRAMGARPTGSHWGGRLIWQLDDSSELLVAYLVLPPTDVPRDIEKEMIEGFRRVTESRPFANDPHRGGRWWATGNGSHYRDHEPAPFCRYCRASRSPLIPGRSSPCRPAPLPLSNVLRTARTDNL